MEVIVVVIVVVVLAIVVCDGTTNRLYSMLKQKPSFQLAHRLVGLVVQASASSAEDPGFESRLRRAFSGSSHTTDLKIGIPVATPPGVIGSALGLVGTVSVNCEWMR